MAKKTKKGQPEMIEMPVDPARAFVHLPGGEKAAEGLENVGLGKRVTLTIKGEVTNLSKDSYDTGARIEVTPERVSVETEDEEISLDDAIAASEVTV